MAKDFVIVKGKVVKMNDAAFQMAAKHFGATKNRPAQRAVPLELLKMPKLPIIPAAKVEIVNLPRAKEKIEPVKVEIPQIETPVVDVLQSEALPVEVKVETIKKKSTVKKRKR